MRLNQAPQLPVPDPKQTMDFLLQGGAFALLCVIVIVGLIILWFGGRALFRLLREHLGTSSTQLRAQTTLLELIHADQKAMRISTESTAATVNPWGSPEWLKERLHTLERKADDIKAQISDVRVALASLTAVRVAPQGAAMPAVAP